MSRSCTSKAVGGRCVEIISGAGAGRGGGLLRDDGGDGGCGNLPAASVGRASRVVGGRWSSPRALPGAGFFLQMGPARPILGLPVLVVRHIVARLRRHWRR